MSILQVANVQFESTGANRIEYTGNNVIRVKGAGLQLPVVTNATKPSAEPGMMLYNSDTGNMEMMGAGGAGLSFASNSSVAAVFAVANAGFGKANTALQNTSGVSVAGNFYFPAGANVGIGTTDVNYGGNVNTIMTINANGKTGLAIAANSTQLSFAINPQTNGSWIMYDRAGGGSANVWTAGITQSNGNVGIGTESPLARLHVNGGFAAFQHNSGGNYPVYNNYFGSIGTNFSNGGSELDIWNNVGSGFAFRSQTNTNAQSCLLYIGANGNVGIGNVSPSAKLHLEQNTASSFHGYAGKFIDNNNAAGNFVPFEFIQTYGNHSWGTVARYRITGTASDRPSIQFSSGFTNDRWSVGYCSGTDDNFRITQNLGYRNDGVNADGWGTERFKIDTSGRVTTPSQPRFCVRTNVLYSAPASTTEMVHTSIVINVGSHYNTSTGRFTAPVAGYYRIWTCFHSVHTSGARHHIAVNGGQVVGAGGGVISSNGDWRQTNLEYQVLLAAGDYISTFVWAGNYIHGDPAWGNWGAELIG